MKKNFFILMVLILSGYTFAQSETALPSLLFQQSPLLQGAGQIGTAVPLNEATSFYFNPAQLGFSSRENNLSFLLMPSETKWKNTPVTFKTSGVAAGYNFKEKYNIPLSVGAGYLHNKFSFGTFTSSNGSFESYDEFDCFSLGAGYDYYLQFNLGLSVKSFKSVLTGQPKGTATGTLTDFGALISAPISKLFFNENLKPSTYLKPDVNFAAGYSLTNIGDNIYYIDPSQKDPFPRTARLGYSLNFGIDFINSNLKMKVVDYSFTAEAEDMLVNSDINGYSYENAFGKIQPVNQLIGLKGSNFVAVHRGHIFRFFETLIITTGRTTGKNFQNNKSNGFGISSEGLFRLLSSPTENTFLHYITDHLLVEYYSTYANADSYSEINFTGFSVRIKNIEF